MAIQRFGNRMVLRRTVPFLLAALAATSCTSPGTSTVEPADTDIIQSVEPTQIYLRNCESCHGMNGDKGVSNAANLKKSILTDADIKKTILEGNSKGMMPYKDLLTEQEVLALVEYVKMLRYK